MELYDLIQFFNLTGPINSVDKKYHKTLLLVFLEFAFKKNIREFNVLSLRRQTWANSFGVPTVEFLMTYRDFFSQNNPPDISYIVDYINKKPLIYDAAQEIFLEADLPYIPTPSSEIGSKFIKTLNQQGYMVDGLDPCSMSFVDYSAPSNAHLHKTRKVLDIGAAFGIASLPILKNSPGLSVYCNDLDENQLRALQCRAILNKTADNLFLLPGDFQLLNIPENFFDAILICRVLHFFRGDAIVNALKLLHKWLVPGGKLFLVVETPYLKNWLSFLPTFLQKKSQGFPYPGEIDQPSVFEQNRSAACPSFLHFFDKETIQPLLIQAGFSIEKVEFIDRKEQFPNDIIYDGRESVGAIAFK